MVPTLSGSILPAVSPPVFPPTNFANNILNTMQTVTTGWVLLVMPVAQKLFLDLAGLEVCWSMGEFILQKSQAGWEGLAIATAKKILQLSIFFWIVSNANTIFWLILTLFQSVSSQLAGTPVMSPGTILQTGINFVSLIQAGVPWAAMLTPPVAFTVSLSSLLLVLSYVIIAGQFMVTIVESYIATSAGILMLGFAGSRFTAQFADKYFAYAIGVGIKLLMVSVVVALGEGISTELSNAIATPGFFTIAGGALFSNLAELVGISLIYAFMAWYIPQLASSLASGSVGMTLGAFMATGASLVGSMFAASKLGGTAVLGGLEKLKGASQAGSGSSPLSSLSKLVPSAPPPYVPPPFRKRTLIRIVRWRPASGFSFSRRKRRSIDSRRLTAEKLSPGRAVLQPGNFRRVLQILGPVGRPLWKSRADIREGRDSGSVHALGQGRRRPRGSSIQARRI